MSFLNLNGNNFATTHGPTQPGMIPDQTSTIDGGCTSGHPSGPVLYPDSDSVGVLC